MFTKHKIAMGVSAGILGVVGVFTSAQAVHMNPDGTGQVLLFPYFNAEEGYQTNINLVNSTDQTKAVKIRFREGKYSNDILDFNLYMSPEDVWTGTVKAGYDESGSLIGQLRTTDRTCTLPLEASGDCNAKTAEGKSRCEAVVSFTGHNLYKNVTAADTREGYVEVIEMGVVEDATVKAGVLHDNGKPTDCTAVENAWIDGNFTQGAGSAAKGLSAPTGGLFGSSAILNVADGAAFAVDPLAIDNYSTQAQHYLSHDPDKFLLPSLASGDVATSSVMVRKSSGEAELVVTNWQQTSDTCLNDGDVLTPACGTNPYPISHVLLAPNLMNEYYLDPSFGYDGHTDWVVTFPMKKHGIHATSTDVLANFENGIFDREEGPAGWSASTSSTSSTSSFGFSPPVGINAAVDDSSHLVREVNVISFKSTDPSYNANRTVMSSPEHQTVSVGPFISGWARLSFPDYDLSGGFTSATGYSASPAAYTAASNIYKGVPATGVAFIEGTTGTGGHRLGDAMPHKIQRD